MRLTLDDRSSLAQDGPVSKARWLGWIFAFLVLMNPGGALAVTPVSPVDGATVESPDPVLSWTVRPNEQPYGIWLANSPTTTPDGHFLDAAVVAYGNLVGATAISPPTLSWSPLAPLTPGTYYWRVLSYLVDASTLPPSSETVWSPVESFNVPGPSTPPIPPQPPPPPVQENIVSLHLRSVLATGRGFEITADASYSYDDGCWSGSLQRSCQFAVPVKFEAHRGRTVNGPLMSQVQTATSPGASSLHVLLAAQLPRNHNCMWPRWREVKRYYSILAIATFPEGEVATATDHELIVAACRRSNRSKARSLAYDAQSLATRRLAGPTDRAE
jgi:hypothetical protein